MQKSLYKWQEECLAQWFSHNGRGIVNVTTGAGKTVLALAIVEALIQRLPKQMLWVKIVAPKTFLATQWAGALRDELGIDRNAIGFYTGKRKDSPVRPFMIYVVNSARYSLARHMVEDFNEGRTVLLIADECHHYGTTENARIFNFIPFIPNSEQYYSLGLSATPYGLHYKEVLAPSLGAEIYRYGFAEALRERIINPFIIFNIRLCFHDDEAEEYTYYTENLSGALSKLKERCPQVRGVTGQMFFIQLRGLLHAADPETASLARTVQLLYYRRKNVVYHARARVHCVYHLMAALGNKPKIIIFTERIETAEMIYQRLKPLYRGEAGLYHSGMGESARKASLRRYEDRELRILVSCKALDEGLNIPETDVGILVSSTNSNRQRIQRLGRILRKNKDESGCMSRLYYLFVAETSEETSLLTELSENALAPAVQMAYNEADGRLINEEYEKLAAAVMSKLRAKNKSAAVLREVKRQLTRGLLSHEWLITESLCREYAGKAEEKDKKNYYTVMLMMIRAWNERWQNEAY